MDFITLLSTNSAWLLVTVGLFSLLIGSFLNVVIYRLPIILERQWKHECKEFLGDNSDTLYDAPFNLVVPRSQCPSCGHAISAWENIPLISYLVLKGRCISCKTPISIQYPIIEAITALLGILAAWKFGYSIQLIVFLPFTWVLIALFMIDAKTMLLPDHLTLPLLWAGILVNYYGVFTDLHSSVMGAMIGYISVWSIFWIFKLLTGKEGMGYGDFKLLAALGAWGGWAILPFVIFSASAFGAIFGLAWMLLKRQETSTPLPFGPWLVVAGWVALFWQPTLTTLTRNYFFP
ncbi:prepilin peptidase [Thiofilum flexile]|uniref:prepilin peptidase n=1 Tax=Thiofilum flexile TaxID=125627 RepID=UPI000360F920|nr:A24 family peptidase [Thiofilum flexile]